MPMHLVGSTSALNAVPIERLEQELDYEMLLASVKLVVVVGQQSFVAFAVVLG